MLEKSLSVRIVPVWTSRSHPRIVLADLGSKSGKDTEEYGLSDDIILYICDYFKVKPEIDGFAIEINKKFDIYFSKYPQSNSAGVNFFAQPYREQKTSVRSLIKTFLFAEPFTRRSPHPLAGRTGAL